MDKILVDKSVLEQALVALNIGIFRNGDVSAVGKACDAIRDVLAQQEQEPVAYSVQSPDDAKCNRITPSLVTDTRLELEEYLGNSETAKHIVPLYTHPPRHEWQSLTDTDIARVFRAVYGGSRFGPSEKEFAIAVEDALKVKNNR